MLNGNEYSTLIPEEFMNVNGIPLNTETVNEFSYDPNNPTWYYDYSNNTDWIGAITQLGNTQEHTLSLRGGGNKALYYTSIDYLTQKGTTKGTDLKRITTRMNLDYNISDRIKIRADIAFAHSLNDRSYNDNIRDIAYRKMPNMGIYEHDIDGKVTPVYFSPESNIQGQYPDTYNPVAMAYMSMNNIKMERVTPDLDIQYSIKPNVWKAQTNIQFDINNTKNKRFLPQIVSGRPWTENVVNQAYDGDNDGFRVQTKTQLIFTPQFANTDNNLVALLNVMTSDNKSISYQAQTSNTASSVLKDPSVPSLDNGSESRLSASSGETRTASALINGQYSYKDRYILNVGLRGDGTSRLAPRNRFGLFPSVSARWRISGEPFMQRFDKQLDELSLRASYGHSGNAPKSDYSFYNTYNVFGWDYLNQGGVYPSSMELKQLKWETVIGSNLGLNLIMFHRRLNVDMEFYRNKTINLYFPNLQISPVNGYSTLNANVGTLINQGWELDIHSTPFQQGGWKVEVNFDCARNVNMLTKISKYFPVQKGDVTQNGQYISFMQVDNPFGSIYGFRYQGVYKDKEATVATGPGGKQIIGPDGNPVYMRFNYPAIGYTFQPGDARYADINHDGNINGQDIVYLGNSNPLFTGGFGLNVSYRDIIKLTTFFNFRYKYDIVNETKMHTTNMYGFDNQSKSVLRRWREPGDVTDMPRALYATGYNWLGSDRYVEDASFVRFRSATIRYFFPPDLVNQWRITNLSCYLTTEYLFTWTKYTGQDPAVNVRGSDPFRIATDESMTPPPLMFTFGLTASL
jgi:TonB-linked SusC/RagA family outer membrane protein